MMRLRYFLCLLGLTACVQQPQEQPAQQEEKRWSVYYGDLISKEILAPFDMVVLESERFADVRPYKTEGQQLLGYISVAEIHPTRSYYPQMEREGVLLGENERWGAYKADIRDDYWRNYIIDELVPYVKERGYDGIMFDTVDTIVAMEAASPDVYGGMTDAFISMLHQIREKHPDIVLVLNRGIEIIEKTAPTIDAVIAESILVNYSHETNESALLPETIYQPLATRLKQSNIEVYTLDYWDITDRLGMAHIYATQRAQGFVPYVSTIDLAQIYDEGGAKRIITSESN